MRKHTPGPWERKGLYVEAGNRRSAGIRIIAHIFGHEKAIWEPNGNLIAAAPDMLEALKAAEEWVCPVEGSQMLWEHIRKAIRKAEGERP